VFESVTLAFPMSCFTSEHTSRYKSRSTGSTAPFYIETHAHIDLFRHLQNKHVSYLVTYHLCFHFMQGFEGKEPKLAAVVTLASSLDYTSSKSTLKLLLPLVSG
jgi:hypothetical protein